MRRVSTIRKRPSNSYLDLQPPCHGKAQYQSACTLVGYVPHQALESRHTEPTVHTHQLPDEPTEPTSTLVLTSVDKRFVDLRLLKPSDTSSGYPTLEWGIGGRSVGTPTHGKWMHDIDSRTMNPEPDEGELSPHPTLPDVTIERGTMGHPESGELREYEEAWKDIPALPVKCGGPHDGKIVTVLLESGGAGTARWGMICRVGQYVQGIVRDGQSVSVQRWAWSEGAREWKKVAQIGDASMVCDVTWNESLQGIGKTFTRDGYTWRKTSTAVAGHGQGGSFTFSQILVIR